PPERRHSATLDCPSALDRARSGVPQASQRDRHLANGDASGRRWIRRPRKLPMKGEASTRLHSAAPASAIRASNSVPYPSTRPVTLLWVILSRAQRRPLVI